MKKLLIATTNPGKLNEIRYFLRELNIKLLSLKDVKVSGKPRETGSTFEQNAIIKARYYFQVTGLPTIADDGGFEIDALGGEPGVKSHRWIHKNREDTDIELIDYTFKKMTGIKNRQARLKAVIAFYTPENVVLTASASVDGIIPAKPSGKLTPGFPYRSILFIPQIGKFYDHDELSAEETDKYNHRRKALEELKPVIKKWLTGYK